MLPAQVFQGSWIGELTFAGWGGDGYRESWAAGSLGQSARMLLAPRADGLWIGFAFGGEDACSQSFDGVFGEDFDLGLEEQGTIVVVVVAIVHATTRSRLFGIEDGVVNVLTMEALATELGQKSRMDVDDAALEVFGDRKQSEVSRQTNQFDLVLA